MVACSAAVATAPAVAELATADAAATSASVELQTAAAEVEPAAGTSAADASTDSARAQPDQLPQQQQQGQQQHSTWWGSAASFQLLTLLEEIHSKLVAGKEFEQLCEECMQALRETCSKALSTAEFRVEPFDWTPDVQLEAFGSTRQGTALLSSDLDVRMTFEQFDVHGFQRQMKYLKGIEAAPGDRFKVVQLVEAKLPVLRLLFDGKLPVDLSMGSKLEGASPEEDCEGVDQSLAAILAAAADAEAAAAALRFVRLVKAFAKTWGLVDARVGLPSSTSWICLAISFLQMERCLPSLLEVEKANGKKDERRHRRLWPVQLSAGFFCRFLAFIEWLGEQPHKVSLMNGRCFQRFAWSNSGAPAHPLNIEFPSERRHSLNIAASLTTDGWQEAVHRCGEAKKFLLREAGATASAQEAAASRAVRGLFEDCPTPCAAGTKRKRPPTGDSRGGG